MKSTRILFVAAIFAIAALCFAQGGGQRGGQRGGRMGGRQQFGYGLLRRTDVQADLQLTTDQKTKIDAIGTAMRTETRGMFPGGGGRRGGGANGSTGGAAGNGGRGTPPTQEEMAAAMAKMKAVTEKYDKQYEAILSPDQQKRVKEIGIQLAGNGIVRDQAVAKQIGFTTSQADRVKALEDKLSAANQAVQDKMRSGELDRTAGRDTMTKNNEALNVEIGKILTEAQRAKLKEMGGKPFVATPQTGGRGGGGGGGG